MPGGPLSLARGRKEATHVKKVTMDPALKVYFKPEEAATYLGIGRTRMYALLREEIRSVKVGRTRHIRRADLDGYMESRLEGVAK
jgi:excisionase family DNA binding protein